jgi:hypothetical protein
MSKYNLWIAGHPIHFLPISDDPQIAIVAFCLAATQFKNDGANAVGFNFTKYKGGIPVIEAYLAKSANDVKLVSILYGVTEEEWKKYGPPQSIELTEEEKKKRGLVGNLDASK